VNFRLEPEIDEALDKVAKRKNLSRNAYVDQVLRSALQKDGGLPGKRVPVDRSTSKKTAPALRSSST